MTMDERLARVAEIITIAREKYQAYQKTHEYERDKPTLWAIEAQLLTAERIGEALGIYEKEQEGELCKDLGSD